VAAAGAGWLGAELHERTREDATTDTATAPPSVPPSAPPSTATTTEPPQTPEGAALTSVTVRTVIDDALRRLRADSTLSARLPAGVDAVAVQVTVTDTRRAGVVSLDAGAGPVEAIEVAAPGATTTNLVVLPVADRNLSVSHGPGGGLTVRLVGTFAAAPASGAGRFVARPPVRVAHLDTAQDGRRLTIPAATYGARPGIRAALVLVSAEVGEVPARLLVGRQPSAVAERMAWGGAVDAATQRRGLALVPVNAAGEFSMRYEHGTALDVDVLGWFTGPGAPLREGALLVPAPARTVIDGRVSRKGAEIAAPHEATGALLNLAADPGVAGDLAPDDVAVASGRTLAVVVDAARGRVHLDALRAIRARVDVLGYFVPE
jgi:hypothetical protein